MRVLFVGDTHADPWSAVAIAHKAVTAGASAIVQCGDFAYTGPHREKFLRILDSTIEAINRPPLRWIDGNHDDFNVLKQLHGEADNPRLPVMTSKQTMHLPRGYRWEWNGHVFLALGGAYSVDEHLRKPGRSWWPEETITPEDVEACGTDPVDVLVTHDSPLDDPFKDVPLEQRMFINLKADMKSRSNRKFIQDVVHVVKPKLVIHGHLHRRYTDEYAGARVEGLANEQTGDDQFYVLDTENP